MAHKENGLTPRFRVSHNQEENTNTIRLFTDPKTKRSRFINMSDVNNEMTLNIDALLLFQFIQSGIAKLTG
jgi:hypothetical protein